MEAGSGFLATVEEGKTSVLPFFFLYIKANTLPHHRVGVSVKRKLGSAVERNYMKRRLKETFRVQQSIIPGHYDIWFVMRKAFDRENAPQALDSFQSLLRAYLSRPQTSPGGDGPR